MCGWFELFLWHFWWFLESGFLGGVGIMRVFGLKGEFLFDLNLFIELSDHFDDGDKIGFGFPCGLIDGPSYPFDKVLVFT